VLLSCSKASLGNSALGILNLVYVDVDVDVNVGIDFLIFGNRNFELVYVDKPVLKSRGRVGG
jgi:hypothetical protein